jgi:DNA-directed RNA polymerase specialized sigma24 family protein
MSEPSTIAEVDNAPPLSRAEIDKAIKFLTAAEKTKIMKIAARYAKVTSYGDGDLFQEACLRAMDGRRKWPRGLRATPFFLQVMRSIASEWKRKDDPLSADIGDDGAEVRRVAAKIDVERIMALFEDDPIAQEILKLMADGARGDDIRKATGRSPTEYESTRRKIRRRIEKWNT